MGRGAIITKIEVQKKHPNRRSIFIDDTYRFGLDEEIVLKNDLRVGGELDEGMIESLLVMEEEKRAKEYVLNLLSYRERSCQEVKNRLREKGFRAEIRDRIVNSLKQAHLLDDERFAREWGRDRLSSRPMGARRLNQELRKKGIAPHIVDQTLEHLYADHDERQLAASALERRKDRYKALEGPKVRRRMADFLRRRGFSWDVVRDVLEDATGDDNKVL